MAPSTRLSTSIGHRLLKLYRDLTPGQAKYHAREKYRWLRYTLRSAKRRARPLAVEIETNNSCTRTCSYCPRPPNDSTVLPEPLFRAVIDDLADWGFRGRISPHGYNEPLSDKRLPRLLEYVSTQLSHSPIVVFSNGDLLTRPVVEQLSQVGVTGFKLSVHEGSSAPQVNALHAFGSRYDRVSVSDYREDHRTEPMFNRGGLIAIDTPRHRQRCFDVEVAVVRANGDVVLCVNDPQKQHVMGNVGERVAAGSTTPFRDIWLEPSFVALRERIHAGDFELEICRNCSYGS